MVRAKREGAFVPAVLASSTGVADVVVVVAARKRLAARLGVILIVSTGPSLDSTDLTVVVVVGLAGRRANRPASPFVDPTVASVETDDG